MAQTGFTAIQLYSSTTPAAVPTAGNLLQGELAINVSDTDMTLYAENASGVVKSLMNNPAGLKYPTADGTNGQVVKTDGAGNLVFVTPLSGTVTSVSVVSANGLSGTVATGTTTPAITLSTSITGVLKGNGTAISAATSNTDFLPPTSPVMSSATFNDGYTEEVFAVTGATPALSPTNGSIQTWVLPGTSTPTAGTWATGQSLTLMIDDGVAATIDWTSLPVTWKTDGGAAPTLNTTGITAIQLWKVGTVIYGARVGDA